MKRVLLSILSVLLLCAGCGGGPSASVVRSGYETLMQPQWKGLVTIQSFQSSPAVAEGSLYRVQANMTLTIQKDCCLFFTDAGIAAFGRVGTEDCIQVAKNNVGMTRFMRQQLSAGQSLDYKENLLLERAANGWKMQISKR